MVVFKPFDIEIWFNASLWILLLDRYINIDTWSLNNDKLKKKKVEIRKVKINEKFYYEIGLHNFKLYET